jgi:hypothetical protein
MSSKASETASQAVATAGIRFYAGLNDYLPADLRFITFPLPLAEPATVASVLRETGVPASEVALVLKNGVPAGFGDPVAADDRVSIYPSFESLDIGDLQILRP